MFGMNLLLQAAECSDDARSISSAVTSSSIDHKHMSYSSFASARPLHSNSKVSRSCSNTSLPPKKRIMLEVSANYGMNNESFQLRSDTSSMSSLASASSRGSGCTDSSTLNSEWTETEMVATEMMTPLQVYNSRKVGNSCLKTSSKKRQLSDASANSKTKRNNTLLLKDVNGNDMCMGYFSMASRQTSSTEDQNSSQAVKPQDAHMRDGEKQSVMSHTTRRNTTMPAGISSKNNSASIEAKSLATSLIFQAYLQALNQ